MRYLLFEGSAPYSHSYNMNIGKIGIAFALMAAVFGWNSTIAQESDIVAIARQFKDGGGYRIATDTCGVPKTVVFTDLLGKRVAYTTNTDGTTYCSGFTFAVAMQAAEDQRLLRDKTCKQIQQFQRDWFGNSQDANIREKQCVAAMVNLGIGKEIDLMEAKPGDFIQFFRSHDRTNYNGHSVIFLRWETESGVTNGFRYRSSQGNPWTYDNPGMKAGIGDSVVFFGPAQRFHVPPHCFAVRDRIYVGRLNPVVSPSTPAAVRDHPSI